MNIRFVILAVLSIYTVSCGSSNSQPDMTDTNDTVEQTPSESEVKIAINQLGAQSSAVKIAVVEDTTIDTFNVLNADTKESVFEGTLSAAQSWSVAGGKAYRTADFSDVTTPGTYVISVGELSMSSEFAISDSVYGEVHDAAIKSYYFNRASTAIEMPYTQTHVRAAGHPDTNVLVHSSAATDTRPEGFSLSSEKGWYDAGDYGKYVVNSGIATFTLMTAFDHFETMYLSNDLGIPESADGIPDILNEVKWNLDWLATMQDTDGGVYHKLTTLQWPGIEMPDEDLRQRYVIGKSTTATLNFAAVMATASRVYGDRYATNGESANWLTAAESAWNWAVNNPSLEYIKPSDVSSGAYGDSQFGDEFAWAAAELYLATNKQTYLDYFTNNQPNYIAPSWQHVSSLALVSMLKSGKDTIPSTLFETLKGKLLGLADTYSRRHQQSPFINVLEDTDFVWGSNSITLNKAMILIQAHWLTDDEAYKHAALSSIDYVLGRNPTGYSFVTGFGSKQAMYPHHRISAADGIDAPIPGMLVGGPQPGKQDSCDYPASTASETFLDDWCSYSTNEIAINWNASLVYMLGFVQSNSQ